MEAWWRNSVGYIIYPEAFCDSNKDGIGDLNGITQKLDYLKDLGINLLWICPIFASPMDDNGYDVSDYYFVNPLFGTNADLDRLIAEAHKRGIRLLLDLAMNHTSNEHPWFKKALADPESKERKYYIFRKGKRVNGRLLPPNNWMSFFSTSAWERIDGTDDFYLHIFSKKMPDTDWSNPELREEYYKIATYYLDKGVDGFRLDALAHLAKDPTFSDSTLPVNSEGMVMDSSKFSNRPELYGYLEEFKNRVYKDRDVLMVGEVGGCIQPLDALKMVDRQNGSLGMLFNFDTVWNNGAYGSVGKKDSEIKTDVLSLKNNFMRWYTPLHEKADLPLYWCNHDHPRVLSQYGDVNFRGESAKMLITTLLFLYGTPFIYYGDEIGMSNVTYDSISDFSSDVGTMNSVAEYRRRGFDDETILHALCRISRVNARTPMQWNGEVNAGFSVHAPINKVNPNYREGVNVQKEMEDPYSIINFFQYAIGIRRQSVYNETVQNGTLELIDPNHPDVFSYLHTGVSKLMVISNFRPYTVYFTFYYGIADVLLHNYDRVTLNDHIFTLRPYETYLLRIR